MFIIECLAFSIGATALAAPATLSATAARGAPTTGSKMQNAQQTRARSKTPELPEIAPPSLAGVTLHQAFEAAETKTEAIPAADETVNQAVEGRRQAVGAVLPKVALTAQDSLMDVPDALAAKSPTIQAEQRIMKIGLTQPLFHGFAEYAGLRSADATERAARRQREAQRLNLFAQVAQSYYALLSAEADVRNLRASLDLTSARVSEVRARARIGRSRVSELLTAQAQTASADASLEAAILSAAQARDSFAFTTGLPSSSAVADLDPGSAPIAIGPLSEYRARLEDRPDFVALKAQLEAADENVTIAQSGHWPALDLGGNYYPYRSGLYQDSKWDLLLTLSIPIFNGGITQSQVRVASSLARQVTLALAQLRRAATRDIEVAHKAAASGVTQTNALKNLVELSERSYQEQTKDYRYGLAQNIDVLTALNALIDAHRSYDRIRYYTAGAVANLEAASGRIP